MVSLYKQLTNAGGSDISTIYSLILLSVITIIAKLAYQILLKEDDVKRLPLINGRKPWSFSVKAEEQNFMQNAASLIEYGFKTVGCQYSRMIKHQSLISGIRQEKHFDFKQTTTFILYCLQNMQTT
jgi:hypothetical protein